jgi:anti-sigma-K factor RskA
MNFFRSLGKKTGVDPSPAAERSLKRELDAAFARDFATARSPFAWFAGLEIFRFAPVAVAAALVIVLGHQVERTQPRAEAPMGFAFAVDDIESSWLDGKGERVEFYDEMEDWMLTASDEDWDAILEKNG